MEDDEGYGNLRNEGALDDLLKNKYNEGEEIDGWITENRRGRVDINFYFKPSELKAKLDQDVIGQEDAKIVLSNAVCYHYARIKRERENNVVEDGGIKDNIMMVGPTGTGKTYLVQKVSNLVKVPFVKCDATKYTSEGYVGRNVEDMVRDLVIAADGNVELAQYGIIYIDEIDKINGGTTFGKDIAGAEVQRSLLKLFEDTEVPLNGTADPQIAAELAAKTGARADMISTKNILFFTSGAFPGLEKLVERRLDADYRENLKWYEQMTSDDLVEYGLEREFVGRLPVRVGLDGLSAEDLFEIMKTSGDSIVKRYVAEFKDFDIDASFTDDALLEIAHLAIEEKTGARALAGVFARLLKYYKFLLPDTTIDKLEFTRDMVADPEGELRKLVSLSIDGEYTFPISLSSSEEFQSEQDDSEGSSDDKDVDWDDEGDDATGFQQAWE